MAASDGKKREDSLSLLLLVRKADTKKVQLRDLEMAQVTRRNKNPLRGVR